MKLPLILIAVSAILIATSCNNSADKSSPNIDTSAITRVTATDQVPVLTDTTKMGGELMTSMHDMMGKMQNMKLTGDFDIDFANMMIEHHQGALAMSQIELSKGKDEKMKAKAQDVITKQTEEQEQLRKFASDYKPSGMKHGEGELQKSMTNMSSQMKTMKMTGNTDEDFATMMTFHHQDGIEMSKMELKNGMSDQLKKIAQQGISSQQKDIQDFKEWLASNQK